MDFPAALLPYREAILATAKPAAAFKPLPASSVIDPKASKMGGIPFTPRYTDWPSSMIQEGLVAHKRPQRFIGQFNFREIVATVPELQGHIPAAGLLQLFFDEEGYQWGTYPADFNFVSVCWFPDIEELTHIPMDQGAPSYPEREFGLHFTLRTSFPEIDNLSLELPEKVWEDYNDFIMPDCYHQVGGYPSSIQNDVLEEFIGEGLPWQLALQIDSDDDMNIGWGDAGALYLLVQAEDLEIADLSQARLVSQCY